MGVILHAVERQVHEFLASDYNEDFSVKCSAFLYAQCYIKPLKFPG